MKVTPERMVAGGDALCREADGRIVFVEGALPGDEIEVDIDDSGSVARGDITRLLAPSTDRVEPPCERRREGCGGCDWQHMAIDAQLDAKAEIVRDSFRRIGKLPDAAVTVGRSVPSEGYRTTIRVVGDRHGAAAYRQADSHDTVPARGCLIAHPNLEPLLDRLRITPDLDVTLRTSAATGRTIALWDRDRGEVDGLPDDMYVGARSFVIEEVDGVDLRVSAASFFQSGPAAAELLIDAVRRAAPELDTATTVLDAYAGVGLFAATVARPADRVITVESAKSAVADSRINLKGRRADIIASEFARWKHHPDDRIDVAIADPARSGLAKPGVAAIVRTEAPVIVLVSCDPVSAARDAALLAGRGYRHAGSEVLDLFPHTHHVEVVSRFERTS